MPELPHNFPTLRREGAGNHRQSVILLGAGMSWGLVPLPGSLLAEKRTTAEATLGCNTTVPHLPNPLPEHLYRWAGEVFDELTTRGDSNPKLTLSESLDIPTDKRWLGCTSSISHKPRHRVVARFAREGLWYQIWSLNWDCVQESALESVGIRRDAIDSSMPWPTVFKTLVTAADCAQMGETESIKVIKPHGCVMALVNARVQRDLGNIRRSRQLSDRFLITERELSELDPQVAGGAEQQFIFAKLLDAVASHPFVIAGWSVSEAYLLNHMRTRVESLLKDVDRNPPIAIDELSIIDRQFNPNGHSELAGFYGKNAASAHIDVGQDGFGTDDLFMWLQALFASQILRTQSAAGDEPALASLVTALQQPPDDAHFMMSIADSFLSAWIRFCWRSGLVPCRNRNNQPVVIDEVDLESRHEHIPWAMSGIQRPELRAASRLVAALQNSTHKNDWNFARFPGCLYKDFLLVIPVPTWASDTKNDLRGLKPLIDSIRSQSAAYIERVAILFVDCDDGEKISEKERAVWKELVSRYLSMARFAKASQIEELPWEEL